MADTKQKSLLDVFPAAELARAIKHIDRYDESAFHENEHKIERALEKCEEVSEKIIEEEIQ